MAVTTLIDGRVICYWRDGGKIRRKYFGRGPGAEIAAWVYHESLGLKKRRAQNSLQGKSRTTHDLSKAYLKARGFSINSLKCYGYRSRNFLRFFGNLDALTLNHALLDQYVNKRRVSGVKASTIHRELTDLLAILNWAVRHKPPLIPYNPVQGYRKPAIDDERILPPTPAETRAMIARSAPHLIRAIVVSHYTGIRPGKELFGLKWQDIDWDNNIIMIRSTEKGGPVKRNVPIMHSDFRALLEQWRGEPDQYIIAYLGKAIRSIRTAFGKAKKHAGITRRLRPYDFRHAFVSAILKRGGDLKAVSEIIGHASPNITSRIYQHVDREMHREAVAKVPSLDIGKSITTKSPDP